MSSRHSVQDPRRIKARDDKLWIRETRKARLYNFTKLQCPCSIHKGIGTAFKLEEIERHLLRHGRSSECRTWRGPDEPDSSDEEWEQEYTNSIQELASRNQQKDNGVQVRTMMQHIFQEVDAFIDTEDKLNNIAVAALEEADEITGVNSGDRDNQEDQGEQPNPSHQCGGENNINAESGEFSGDRMDGQEPVREEQGIGEASTFNVPEEGDNRSTEDINHNIGHSEQHNNNDNPVPLNPDSERLEGERLKDAKALEDAMELLYKDSKHSKLAATIMVVNLVATHSGITEKAADDILATFKNLLPANNCLPGSMYQAKTLTRRLGLDFTNIDGCPQGCVLFDQEDTKNLDRCPKCHSSRYADMLHRTRPLKVLRQFPVTPRLVRFYRIPVLSKLMRWHDENKSRDGKVRYPADSRAWRKLDNMDPSLCDTMGFGQDIRDVRLQVACDGICPFKLHRSSWAAWPVLASLLNLPPWLITKKFFTMLTLLIPGKHQVPFAHFDVWIRPLIDELKTLWRGVPAYDVLAPEGDRAFNLRAAVLYTTHDFPGYGTVSGASHQGYAACPPCGNQLLAKYAYESKKLTYRDARRWLRPDHYIRSSRFDSLFDGHSETRLPPVAKTPEEQRAALREYHNYLRRIGIRTGSRPRATMPSTPTGQPADSNLPEQGGGLETDNVHHETPGQGSNTGEMPNTASEQRDRSTGGTQGTRSRLRRRGGLLLRSIFKFVSKYMVQHMLVSTY